MNLSSDRFACVLKLRNSRLLQSTATANFPHLRGEFGRRTTQNEYKNRIAGLKTLLDYEY